MKAKSTKRAISVTFAPTELEVLAELLSVVVASKRIPEAGPGEPRVPARRLLLALAGLTTKADVQVRGIMPHERGQTPFAWGERVARSWGPSQTPMRLRVQREEGVAS